MSKIDGIGCKGGTSATAGKRSEIITAAIGTLTWSKRVFKGQRALVVPQLDETDEELLLTRPDLESAQQCATRAFEDGYCIAVALAAAPI